MLDTKDFIKTIKERAEKSKIYKKYQLIGLVIAQLLNDEKHKSLYIKLAKEQNADILLSIAKDVSERKQIKNKGAYFMKILSKEHRIAKKRENKKEKINIEKIY